jgi:hypothetical protein
MMEIPSEVASEINYFIWCGHNFSWRGYIWAKGI